ncbi:hypothetical protein ACPOL_3923 [Acidisarcina polymorpha]|uniref:Uncharacterized protein n=1 Tax=Acidisarcina polymorpha TaxID=2211140 RepID=A0A2Z5G288_9BACT|nr:hypothetical protein [Acidisarcina polymorpha]AXC13202.1 hypothetical protein ACPOL_3923 [Acidisarcina polymorpha]
MLKAVEFGLLAVSLLVILGLIVVGPGAYSQSGEGGDLEIDSDPRAIKSTKA